MSNLVLAKSEPFGNVQCDFWRNGNGDVFMTIDQLAQALGYAGRDGIEKMIERNPYLLDSEFSTTDKLSAVEGGREVERERRIFTEDGIYEVTMLSRTTIAREFRTWFREVIKTIRKTGGYVANDDLFIETYLSNVDEQTKLMFRATLATVRKLNEEKAIMQPKAEYFDALVDRNLLTNLRDTAKELKIRQTDFIAWLLDRKFVYRDQRGDIRPYAQHVPTLFELKEWARGEKAGVQTLITPKGKETFRLLYSKQISRGA